MAVALTGGWSCSSTTYRDINYGTDAGAGFEAPPREAASGAPDAAAGGTGGTGSGGTTGTGGTTGSGGITGTGGAGGSGGNLGSGGTAGADANDAPTQLDNG